MTAAPRLSLCMIVKNEEVFLGRCLDAVASYVDEIIVVDTGSTDRTRAIALERTEKVYDFEWVDDFALARNYSLEKASGDWILVLDADELLAPGDMQKIRSLIADTENDAFFLMQYNYDNDPLIKDWRPVMGGNEFAGGYAGYRPNPIARLFRNNVGISYQGPVHEVIDQSLDGFKFSTVEIPIHHHVHGDPTKPKFDRQRNYLRIMEKALEKRPDGRLYSCAGSVCMYHTGDYARAANYFKQALALGYEADNSSESLAEAYYRAGDLDQARAIYSRLYQSGYLSASLCTNLANLLVKSGDFPKAVELLRSALTVGNPGQAAQARIRHNIDYLERQIRASG